MKKIVFLCLVALVSSKAFCQYDNNWVFGDSAGLYFHDGITESFRSSILTEEASSSISDIYGNLLFYTNGELVWNKNNYVMPLGENLHIGLINNYGSSITQGVVIIPLPGSNSLYYIFQLQDYDNPGIEYSIVDMNLDGGLGDITEKNIKIYDKLVTEKLQAVKHANGRDWWIMTQAKPNYDETTDSTLRFVSFLLTPTGVEGPFEQVYGPKDNIPYNGWGQMVFTQSGDKLAATRVNMLDIYDFDRCTGLFSGWQTIQVQNEGHSIYGAAFSPSGSKLYVSAVCDGTKMYQYCLTCDGDPITDTKDTIFINPYSGYCIGQMQLGPDSKIYVALYKIGTPSDTFTPINKNFSVINNPDLPCPACDFDTLSVSLGDRRVICGLPNMPNYNLGALVGSGCDTLTAISDIAPISMQLYPNPAAHSVSIAMPAMPITIRLQTMLGTTLYTQQVATGHAVIPLQDFPQGIYIVSLEVNHIIMATQKLVIQR